MMRPSARRAFGVLCSAAVLLLAAAACDGGTAGVQTPPALQSPAPVTTHPAQEAINPDPAFDWGYTVQITNTGFHPHQLVAPCCHPVTWKNLTVHNWIVDFDYIGMKSDPIPPGGTWVWAPKGPQSVAFHLEGVTGVPVTGSVLVQQTAQE